MYCYNYTTYVISISFTNNIETYFYKENWSNILRNYYTIYETYI